jgi:hypothetical protein
MKCLLIVNGESKELDIDIFDISYNKFKGYDLAIILDSNTVIKPKSSLTESVDTVFDNSSTNTSEIVNTPSAKGILLEDVQLPDTIEGLLSEDEQLELRTSFKSPVVYNKSVSKQRYNLKPIVIVSDTVSLQSPYPFKAAFTDLLNKELEVLHDYLTDGKSYKFVIHSYPTISFNEVTDGGKNERSFYLVEYIYISNADK